MSKLLNVYLYQHLAGQLIQEDSGKMYFEYTEEWLQSLEATPLSQSLPLEKKCFTHEECQGFFAGILPEENKRKIIARNLGISARNDFAMLEKIGGECAGAITFLLPSQALSEKNNHYHVVENKELAEILRALPSHPLLAGEKDVRLSLAGAQDKISVYVDEGKIAIPYGGAPSTHILKPAVLHLQAIVFNEALCMKLAAAIGLSVAKVAIGTVEDIDYLLIERYDRIKDGRGEVQRMHQEDFCQALGFVPEMKYQQEGGPSLKQCFDLVRRVASNPVLEIRRLLDAVIFNLLIGNHDAHGKNFSLLYCPPLFQHSIKGEADRGATLEMPIYRSKDVCLAPLYDLLCTVYYPQLSHKMAMKIGGEYRSDEIYPSHFDRLASEIELAKPFMKQRVLEMAEIIIEKLDTVTIEHTIAEQISVHIKKRCTDMISRFTASTSS